MRASDPCRWAAVVLDMDGVIVDSEALYRLATKRYAAEAGFVVPDALLDWAVGRRTREVVAALAEIAGRPVEDVGAARGAIFREVAGGELVPMPRLLDALESLRAAGLRLAVATGSSRWFAELVLARFGIREFFDQVVCGEDVTQAKPHPETYLLATARLGLPPARCAAIEDTPLGVESAAAAGLCAVAVPSDSTIDVGFPYASAVHPDIAAAAAYLLAGV